MRKACINKKIKDFPKTIIISFDKIADNNEGINLNDEIKIKDLSYHLIAIIKKVKEGENAFIAICKNSLDNNWYYFDNEKKKTYPIQSFLQLNKNPLIIFVSCNK